VAQSRDFPKGEQTETTLNGLTVIAGQQLADTHSAIAPQPPLYGTSRQLHKCALWLTAHAVYRQSVCPNRALGIDAGQPTCCCRLDARVDTKPQLEIIADT